MMSFIIKVCQLAYLLGSLSSVNTMVIGSKTPERAQLLVRDIYEEGNSPKHYSTLLNKWRAFDSLRDSALEEERLGPFFAERPFLIVERLLHVTRTLVSAKREWEKYSGQENVTEVSWMDKRESQAEIERAAKLCDAVSSLGPVAVKLGQTLSQRPDLVGLVAAKALKRLQTRNVPFDDALAHAVLRESLNWKGPLAPGIGINVNETNVNPNGVPLFSYMSEAPAACASLGQVYKAKTMDGRDIAVKIQRPDAMALLATDAQCFRIVFVFRGLLLNFKDRLLTFNSGNAGLTEDAIRGNQTIGSVIDRVACDIKREIDYRIEAENADKFLRSLDFLGFVTTPTVVQATERVLMTEWIPGKHMEDLSVREGLAMTRMAVEACTASMVLTGFVHADPHEGNIMLHEDGRLVFLDFGLMSDVDQDVMEAFARGIQALLSEDWLALTEAFVDVGFVNTPIMYRDSVKANWRIDPNYGAPQLADALELAMKTTEGGESRFGALATVLNKKISPNWLVFTPPYVLLLIRTFLTLEGIAASADPDFNIYEMSVPWVVRRSLSPSTQKGIDVFRSTILTDDNRIQWERLLELLPVKDNVSKSVAVSEDVRQKKKEQEVAKQAAMKDAIGTLLGSIDGKALRSVLKDLDTTDLLMKLASPDGRPLLEMATKRASQVLKQKSKDKRCRHGENLQHQDTLVEGFRPISHECLQLQERQTRWKNRVVRVLIWSHIRRCLFQFKGVIAMARLVLAYTKITVDTFLQRINNRHSHKVNDSAPLITPKKL